MYFEVLIGFALLLFGAEILVRGSVGCAQRLGVSKLVIGMTVLALGTSSPELIVSLNSALSGSSGIAVGNLVGSNVANILLILGVSGVILPLSFQTKSVRRDGYMLLLGTCIFAIIAKSGQFRLEHGLLLMAIFLCFLYFSYKREKHDLKHDDSPDQFEEVDSLGFVPKDLWMIIVLILIGFVFLISGAEILVGGSIKIAQAFGVSEAVIGLTIIAFGTSLPELATSGVAAFRKQTDLVLGNVIGSNIFNIVAIIGIVSLMVPLDVPDRIASFDLWVMFVSTLVLIPFLVRGKGYIGRGLAVAFLAGYLCYITAIFSGISSF
ncbi:MAG: calcium/sodium antiporter [Pseudomonadota bacterium]|nr:calcium/sodium antiporter [Pseudomonadota bacterium]